MVQSSEIAELEVQQSLEVLKRNVDQSEKNMKILADTIAKAEIAKENLKTAVDSKVVEHTRIQKKIGQYQAAILRLDKDHGTFKKAVTEDQTHLNETNKQILELEKVLAQLKQNQITLQENLQVSSENIEKMVQMKNTISENLVLANQELLEVTKIKSDLKDKYSKQLNSLESSQKNHIKWKKIYKDQMGRLKVFEEQLKSAQNQKD